jgi:hypothetical protein
MDLSRVWSLIIVAFRVQVIGRSITEAIERLKPVLIFCSASRLPSLEIEESKCHLRAKR